MTTVHFDPKAYKLELRGHAGAGRQGEDLVCAGASALAFAALNAAKDREDYHAEVYMDWENADILVECSPERDAEEACAEMFRVILHGFAVLKQRSPEHIRVVIE